MPTYICMYIYIYVYGRRKIYCIDYWVPLRIPISMLGALQHTIFNTDVHHSSDTGIQGVCNINYMQYIFRLRYVSLSRAKRPT